MYPYIYEPVSLAEGKELVLSTDNAKHISLVLRKQAGDRLIIVDGKGHTAHATITSVDKKQTIATIDTVKASNPRPYQLVMAVAFTKNRNRNEWMLEKMTEIGVDYIIPLKTARSERDSYKHDRLQAIIAAAMIQSQQCYMPHISEPKSLGELFDFGKSIDNCNIVIAHCIEDSEKFSLTDTIGKGKNVIIMIGPEGDFTEQEIQEVIQHGGVAVSFGSNRLRTETAAIYACAIFNQINYAL